MIRVLCGYIDNGLRQETYSALVTNVPIGSLELVNMTGNISNYWHEFRKRWLAQFDLVTIEQDNVITPEVIPSFEACDQPWCVFEYLGPPVQSHGARLVVQSMGCARFSRKLQQELPVSKISDKDYLSWQLLDSRLGIALRSAGYVPHVHGRISHLHEYSRAEEIGRNEHLKSYEA